MNKKTDDLTAYQPKNREKLKQKKNGEPVMVSLRFKADQYSRLLQTMQEQGHEKVATFIKYILKTNNII